MALQPDACASGAIVFCDLDGTLVLDNSFHTFMAAFWTAGSIAQRLALLAAVGPRVLGRAAGGHAGLKRRVLRAFGRENAAWQQVVIGRTIARMKTTTSEPILRLLAQWRERGARIVLATAAPDLYAQPFAQLHGASCIATNGTVGPGWHELLAERKAAACRPLIAAKPKPRVVVLTDHSDDLPLLGMADQSVVQGSAARLGEILSALGPIAGAMPPAHIDPTVAQDGGGHWLWIDDRPHGPFDVWEVRTVLSKHRHALLYSGGGHWVRIGPGQPLDRAVLRRDCPLPPPSRQRVLTFVRRRVLRDLLGIFH